MFRHARVYTYDEIVCIFERACFFLSPENTHYLIMCVQTFTTLHLNLLLYSLHGFVVVSVEIIENYASDNNSQNHD